MAQIKRNDVVNELVKRKMENLQLFVKERVDPYLSNILKQYSFTDEVKWRYEYFENPNYDYHSFIVSVVFIKRNNEDNYGFDISFKLLSELPDIIITYIARGNGSIILDERNVQLSEIEEQFKKLEQLIYEYCVVAGLLVKEYILETNVNPS